jgi:hypothetical protein
VRFRGLEIVGSRTFWQRDWPSFNDAFLSAFVASGGGLELRNVVLAAQNSMQLAADMQALSAPGSALAADALPLLAPTAAPTAALTIASWSLSAEGWAAARGAAAGLGNPSSGAAGSRSSRWTFANVTVTAAPEGRTCFGEPSSFVARTSADLLALLKDEVVQRIEVRRRRRRRRPQPPRAPAATRAAPAASWAAAERCCCCCRRVHPGARRHPAQQGRVAA